MATHSILCNNHHNMYNLLALYKIIQHTKKIYMSYDFTCLIHNPYGRINFSLGWTQYSPF